jgi:putative glutamine amidotransferase
LRAHVPHPLIGISTSELRTAGQVNRSAEADPPRRELALALSYPRSIARFGGVPLVIPPAISMAEELVAMLDGLLLSGGPDLDPGTYGEDPHPALGPTEPELDAFELDIVRLADEARLPILGLCRGAQVLNVAYGGTLVQDLADRDGLRHRQIEPGEQTTHTVTIDPGTRLAAAMGSGEHEVNSFHHQSVREIGHGLRVVARASDGVPEAIEAEAREFVIGVQWHAESLAALSGHDALFQEFIAVASSHAKRRHARAA